MCAVGESTNGGQGATSCASCANRTYADAEGSASCSPCDCNWDGTKSCDATTGTCECVGLWTGACSFRCNSLYAGLWLSRTTAPLQPFSIRLFVHQFRFATALCPSGTQCNTEQSLVVSYLLGYFFLVMVAFVCTPIMFYTGKVRYPSLRLLAPTIPTRAIADLEPTTTPA